MISIVRFEILEFEILIISYECLNFQNKIKRDILFKIPLFSSKITKVKIECTVF
ncbi:hypothetical protein PGB90_009729 [Kerria lacca]